MTGHSHFQTSSTSSAKFTKMAKSRLVASVVSQELLEELVLLHCESVDESEYLATCLGMFVIVTSEKPLSYQGSENRRFKRAP